MKTLRNILTLALVVYTISAMAQPNNPNNPVPLDGGLSLLAAGGAYLGYRKHKKAKALKNKTV